jgi:hypothetical protein
VSQVFLYSKLAYASRRERREGGSNETTTKKREYLPILYSLYYILNHTFFNTLARKEKNTTDKNKTQIDDD